MDLRKVTSEKILIESYPAALAKLKNEFIRMPTVYNPNNILYKDKNGNTIVRGQQVFEQMLIGGKFTGRPIYASPILKVDGAFEGGGAKAISYLGGLHAMSHCGLWFEKVSGTSGGSLIAALIAAGYEVDLNYKINTLISETVPGLPARASNSLNQILFEEDFGNVADFDKGDDPKVQNSATSGIVKELLNQIINDILPINNSINRLRTYNANVTMSDVNGYLDKLKIKNNNNPIILTIITSIKAINGGIGLILDMINSYLSEFRKDVQSIGRSMSGTINNTLDQKANEVVNLLLYDNTGKISPKHRRVFRALFRLLERGGFWTGNVVVSLLEKHLQAKISVIKRPTGPNGTVAFQDLPIDFCCTATDVGRLPDSSVGAFDTVYVNQSQSQIVYFSKKTSPTYSVAEAVRRSVSLPIVFYPLKINEGNGMNFPSSNRIFYHLDRKKFLIDPANINRLKNQKAYDMSVHNNHILLDGGFRVNLPVGVMRDPDNVVFDNNLNADGSPRNFLFAFNLTDLDTLPQRPDGIPLKSDPEPLPSILSTINDMIEGVFSGENSPVNNAINTDGLKRVKKALAQTMDYAAGSRQEQEIIDLLALVPKVIPVNIPSKDPSIDNGDDRFSGEAFGMPNLEKKWIAGSAWNAMNEALSNLKINNFPLGVASNIRPYEHGLIINLQTPNAGSLQFKSVSLPRFGGGAGIPLPLPQNQIQDSPATINDTYYSDENFKFSIPPGLINPLSNILGRISDYHFEGNQKSRYVGPGTYWIKTKNSDKTNSADNYLMFDVNNPVRVYLIIDIIYKQNHNSLPAFLRDKSWKDTGIELSSNDRAVSGPPVTGSSAVGSGQNNSMNLFVMQKDFEIGTITLGGMRSGGGKDNRCNYSVLVVQRD